MEAPIHIRLTDREPIPPQFDPKPTTFLAAVLVEEDWWAPACTIYRWEVPIQNSILALQAKVAEVYGREWTQTYELIDEGEAYFVLRRRYSGPQSIFVTYENEVYRLALDPVWNESEVALALKTSLGPELHLSRMSFQDTVGNELPRDGRLIRKDRIRPIREGHFDAKSTLCLQRRK